MSKGLFRTIDTNFWTDIKVSDDLTSNERYFFLYLLTNPATNLIGCYELSFRKASIDTGLTTDDVKAALNKLIELNIAKYDSDTKEVLVVNWLKHNLTDSPKMRAGVSKQLLNIKSKELYSYIVKIFNALTQKSSTKDNESSLSDIVDLVIEHSTDVSIPEKYRNILQKKISKFLENHTSEDLITYCYNHDYNVNGIELWMSME